MLVRGAEMHEKAARWTSRAPRPARPGSLLLTFSQAALELGIPASSLRDAAHRGHLPVVVLPGGRRQWLRRTDLLGLIQKSLGA